MAKKKSWWEEVRERQERKQRELSWPAAFQAVMLGIAWLGFGSFILYSILFTNVPFDAQCEVHDWKMVPENVTFIDEDIAMYPDYMNCRVSGKMSGWQFGETLLSLTVNG